MSIMGNDLLKILELPTDREILDAIYNKRNEFALEVGKLPTVVIIPQVYFSILEKSTEILQPFIRDSATIIVSRVFGMRLETWGKSDIECFICKEIVK